MPPYSHVIGLMSGTSLDGLDIAYCTFDSEEKSVSESFSFHDVRNIKWKYKIHKHNTITYPSELSERLASAMEMTAFELALLDVDLGRFIGETVKTFVTELSMPVDLIASHGHTVFHRPELGLTSQIGSGATIAAITGIPTVCDFRTTDVALGGQGAPLVPIGDELLFSEYDICLNLGGISNLSFRKDNKRIAYDISPCNIVLNLLAQKVDKSYDADGEMARSGHLCHTLLERLNQLDYYQIGTCKSLGREWIDLNFLPLIENCGLDIADCLRTVSEHIAEQIGAAANRSDGKSMLITGGGAHNRFLVELIQSKFHGHVVVPDKATIDYKEALIFAFLGFLRANGWCNCLASVTGASRDCVGGGMYC